MKKTLKSVHPPILRFLFYLGLLVLFCVVLFYLFIRRPLPEKRTSFVVLGEPVEVLSYDQERKQWTVIQLTKDTHMSGVFGLGTYRLDALWKLGQSEATPSVFLRESIAEEFGVALPYVVFDPENEFRTWGNEFSHAKDIFTFNNLFGLIRGSIETTMSPSFFLRLILPVRQMNESNTNKYILRENSGLVKLTDKDGTPYLRFDRQAFDIRTAAAFEELSVRKEAKRIVVYNTTNRPAIGSRVGRMIAKLGANVVAIGNDHSSRVTSCEINGTKDALSSLTAKRIAAVFECELKMTEEESQGDLTVRVGEIYAKRYMLTDQ